MRVTELDVIDVGDEGLDVTGETLAQLRVYEAQLANLGRTFRATTLEIGRVLCDVHTLLPSKDVFERWVERGLGWSLSTAYNYKTVYEVFGGRGEELAALPIPDSGLTMLARKNVSESLRERIIDQARKGQKLRVKDIERQIKAQAAPAQAAPAATAELPPTECLFCGRKNVMIYPLRGTRRGICGGCMAEGLQFMADMQRGGLTPDLGGNGDGDDDGE